MKREHLPQLGKLLNQLSPGKYSEGLMQIRFSKLQINPDYTLWVAIDEDEFFTHKETGIKTKGKVVGTAMLHLQHKFSHECGSAAHIEDVVVDEEYRKLNIGKKLIEIAINKAREENCYKVMLTCFEHNVPFYEKLGFEVHDVGMRLELNIKKKSPVKKENK